MATPVPVTLSAAVEGVLDEAVLRRILADVGGALGPVHGGRGKNHLRQRLPGYNNAARFSPWIVLVDLDNDAQCAPPFAEAWLPQPAAHMHFRVAVRAVEAWLLADRKAFARFLGVSPSAIPSHPEGIPDPKQMVVHLAQQARRSAIREDIVPRPGSGRRVGPAYSSRLTEFVEQRWRPDIAASLSESLRRCRERIAELASS
jgi:hypothetical protein